MKLSVVIPAFNEEKLIGSCLKSVHAALQACARPGLASEIVVCDNNSSDRTAAIAREHGAKVVFEPHNQISRARNAGAEAATGDWLLFIDADSLLDPQTLKETLGAIETGRFVGGGSLIVFDETSWLVVGITAFWNAVSRVMRWAAGSFVFCRADAFRDVRGFSADLYAAEEIALSKDLKAWGKPRKLGFTILARHPHLSSGRKAKLYSLGELLGTVLRWTLSPKKMLRDPKGLFVFYDRRR